MNEIDSLLDGFPVVVQAPVAWGDMDYFRHVNNIVFFRYFESARIVYLDRIGFRGVDEREAGPILHSTSARFRRPVAYPDVVHAGARTVRLEDDRLLMEYRVIREGDSAVAAEGEGIVVAFDYRAGRKCRVPAGVRREIERLEGWLPTRAGGP
jgi:acyl-CoA thioester hydrolase